MEVTKKNREWIREIHYRLSLIKKSITELEVLGIKITGNLEINTDKLMEELNDDL